MPPVVRQQHVTGCFELRILHGSILWLIRTNDRSEHCVPFELSTIPLAINKERWRAVDSAVYSAQEVLLGALRSRVCLHLRGEALNVQANSLRI